MVNVAGQTASNHEEPPAVTSTAGKKKSHQQVLLRTCYARALAPDGSSYKVRVFLDSGGELNLIT